MSKSMKGHQPQASKDVDWCTPRWILDRLGSFDLDPCTPPEMPWVTARDRYTKSYDGLAQSWYGRVWLNPPFDEKSRAAFLEKMAAHGNGIALVSVATETEWFKMWIWPFATSILFLNKRPHFHRPDGTRAKSNSGCSICLVGYGAINDEYLRRSDLGHYMKNQKGTQ